MKKNCHGCRAQTSHQNLPSCQLGYSVNPIWFGGVGGSIIGGKPTQECPKPKTNSDMSAELKLKGLL